MTDRELPPLPEPDFVSHQTDSVMRHMELRSYSSSQMRVYGRACAEAENDALKAENERLRQSALVVVEMETELRFLYAAISELRAALKGEQE